MTLKKALSLVEREYKKALAKTCVRKPLAYALYMVWIMADSEPPKKQEKDGENDE